MKIYLRLLALISPVHRPIILYVVAVIFAVLFSSINITLLIPLLNVIFDSKAYTITNSSESIHSFSIGIENIKDTFTNFLSYILSHYGKFTALIYICAIVFISTLLANVFTYIARITIEKLRIKILFNLRNVIFKKIVNLDIQYFNNSRKGDLISLASSDIYIIQGSLVQIIELLSFNLLQILSYLVILLLISIKLTVFSIVVIPVAGIIISSISRKLKNYTIDSQVAHGSMISFLENMIYGIKIVKAFNAVEFISKRYTLFNTLYSKLQFKIEKRRLLASPVSAVLFQLTALILILYAGTLLFSGKSTFNAAEFFTYLVVFTQIITPLKVMLGSVTGIYTGIAATERIFGLLDVPITIKNTEDGKQLLAPIPKLERSIEFKNVSFGYIKGVKVLKELNFSIPKSRITAIVGPSGAGKSTITELLLRFYDIDEGEILIDGVNIKNINITTLRGMMAIVSQEPILFNDTIYNNISFGLNNISLNQVEDAAKIANIHDFIINTEKGYQTNIGDRGLKLSGGQKQRLGIARAVCNKPDILILDEATSALDAQNEKMVQEALEKVMKTCTSLVIAHRLSTIKNADNIIVMDAGRVVANGSHDDLMAKGGLYKQLIDLQSFT